MRLAKWRLAYIEAKSHVSRKSGMSIFQACPVCRSIGDIHVSIPAIGLLSKSFGLTVLLP